MTIRRYACVFPLLLSIGAISICKGQTDNSGQKTAIEIQKSYIDANVPDKPQFESFATRDLEKYFYGTYGLVTVKWEFLRETATQSGAAYPKFYLWTKIYKDSKLINEGATRLAAIEKIRFEITDFVSIAEIKNNTVDIYSIFPSLVCEKIKSKL